MLVPNELLQRRIWVCHRAKLPWDVQTGRPADSSDPQTWTDYRTAERALWKYRYDGLSFALGNGLTGIDLDACFDFQLNAFAREICNRIRSYTEFSLSGTGVHVIAQAEITAGRRKPGIEVYGAGRFFAFTGTPHAASPRDVQPRQAEIDALLAELFPALPSETLQPAFAAGNRISVPESDAELLQRIQRSVVGARFERLWAGDTSAHKGDHSAADMALCRILLRSTNGDKARADRLFRQSKLFREKWDRPWRDSTYGQRTLAAIR